MKMMIRKGVHRWAWYCPYCGVLSIWHPSQRGAFQSAMYHWGTQHHGTSVELVNEQDWCGL